MSIMKRLKGMIFGSTPMGYPTCPSPRVGYTLATSDMIHFDVLDGDEECGGIEMKGNVGEVEAWVVHVYGVDLICPSLGKARAWLGKPDLHLHG